MPQRQNSGIIARRDVAASHVGTILQHGGELQQPKVLAAPPYPLLSVKDLPFARATQNESKNKEERSTQNQTQARTRDINDPFHECEKSHATIKVLSCFLVVEIRQHLVKEFDDILTLPNSFRIELLNSAREFI